MELKKINPIKINAITVDNIQIHKTVIVVIAPARPHGIAAVTHNGSLSVVKRSVAKVPVQKIVFTVVIGHKYIQVAVIVYIRPADPL